MRWGCLGGGIPGRSLAAAHRVPTRHNVPHNRVRQPTDSTIMPSQSYGKVYIALTLGHNHAQFWVGARAAASPVATQAYRHRDDQQKGADRRQRHTKAQYAGNFGIGRQLRRRHTLVIGGR